MKRFILIYSGESNSMPETPEEGLAMIEAWKAWYSDIGEDLLDGGFPFKEGALSTDGNVVEDSNLPVHGYLIIQAENQDDALDIANKSPLPEGGKINIYEEQKVPGM